MQITLGRWKPKLVVLACAVYGAAVALVTFAPALASIWRITRPDAGHGVVSVSADNTLMMHFTMTSAHLPTWTGSFNLGALLLWLLAPPLLLWIAWLASGPRHAESIADQDNLKADMPALNEPLVTPFASIVSRESAAPLPEQRRER
jgi:hypothetical protein